MSCPDFYVNLVEEVEAGGDMHPLFFTNKDCSGPIFPKMTHRANINWESALHYTKHDMCPDGTVANCMPGFQKIYVPDGFEITFNAKQLDSVDYYNDIAEWGIYKLNPVIGVGNISNNIWTAPLKLVDGGGNSTANLNDKWYNPLALRESCVTAPPVGSTFTKTIDGENYYLYNTYTAASCKSEVVSKPEKSCCETNTVNHNCGCLCTKCSTGNSYYTADHKLKASIFSCGSIFWPTFGGYRNNSDLSFSQGANVWGVNIDKLYLNKHEPDNIVYVTNTNHCIGGNFDAMDGLTYDDIVTRHINPVTYGALSITTNGLVPYSSFDCIIDNTITYDYRTFPYTCQQPQGDVSESETSANNCTGKGTKRASGSVGSFDITPKQTMVDRIINACTGVTPMQVAGFTIHRYQNGSPDCEDYFNQICTNTAIIKTNKVYRKACSCILEKKRLEFEYRNINLPVACFSDVCNNPEPGVFKTRGMISGCNTKLCQQIVDIHGSDIAHEGYQTLLCDNHVYKVSTNDLPKPDLPNYPNNINPQAGANVSFSAVFYFALAFTGLLFLIIIVWLVRKAVLKRQKAEMVNRQDTQNVSSMIRGF